MGWMQILGLSMLFLAICVGYLLHTDVPNKWPQPWKTKMTVLAPLKLINLMTTILEPFMGPDTYFILIKRFYKSISLSNPTPKSDKYVKVTETNFGGVPVLLYEPTEGRSMRRAVFYMHGGGFVFGDIKLFHPLTREIAVVLGAVVVSVDYRLSPGHKYPDHLDDCINAYKHFVQMADELGFDPNRIAIGGDSAGGSLAAALALYLRDNNFSPRPKLQVFLSPCLQATDFNSPSYNKYKSDTFLSQRTMAGYWLMYARGHIDRKILDAMVTNKHTSTDIKRVMYSTHNNPQQIPQQYVHKSYIPNADNYGEEAIWDEIKDTFLDPYFAPLMAKDLKNLPATYMMTVEQDVIRDDGIWYAQRLSEAGNDVTHVHHAHALHGMPGYLRMLNGSREIVSKMLKFVQDKL